MIPTEYWALQKIWYDKLKETGFYDIEKPSGILKAEIYHVEWKKALNERESREAYRDWAQTFLNRYRFKSELEKRVWECHCDGLSIRETAKALGQTRYFVESRLKQLKTQAGLCSK